MLNAAGCLIAKKPRQMQESKEIKDQEMKVWMGERITFNVKYGTYEKLMKHLRESDENTFKNLLQLTRL
jgi:NOL1/NOP2/fmu family ribosome biogenesis protein